MRLLIQHRSRYDYPEPGAHLGPHILRLRPTAHARARIESYSLTIGADHVIRWQQDPYGNHVAQVHFPPDTPTRTLDILVEMAVEVRPINPFDFLLDDVAERVPFAYPPALARELAPFLALDDPALAGGDRLDALDRELPRDGGSLELLTALNTAVNRRVAYVIREEAGVYTPEECLRRGRASCRDSAVLLIALLRRRGLAARFVSGYLIQLTDEGMLPDQPRGVSRDVVDLHAWCEVFLPGAGWVGLDATSGLLAGEGHIPLAAASTPALAAPLEGTSDLGAERVAFEMVVGRVGHEPSPTAPYSPEVWDELGRAAARADATLLERGVSLTMGGEPTFNAREGTDEPEWNGAALGPGKWTLGLRLAAELRRRIAPGAATIRASGKWYPGESLPRWALEMVARKDGTRLWPDRPAPTGPAPATGDDARRFAEALADRLGVRGGLHPAYEDPWCVVEDESRLAAEVDAARAELDDPEARRRLARILSRGVGAVAGWVLPLAPAPDDTADTADTADAAGWLTERWTFRRGELFLLPGDSAIGLRLPLGSLSPGPPLPEPPDEPFDHPPDPRRADADADADSAAADQPHRTIRAVPPAPTAAPRPIRTALCVEARAASPDEPPVIEVFLPPVASFDQFCRLLAAIDETRVQTGLPVELAGYPPPRSPDALRFSVTPDPGVLEVNLPPAATMAAYTELIDHTFAAALASGLHAEKYLVDGRMSGSGGGNHITLGGPTPLSSPFIRRPDLLASLITFIQHHPSLSYMFSGLFIGPTSQAPRVDEARLDTLDELEIALARAFRREDASPPPWLSDLLFRHLLVDLTGNTHRAELSIDKLFDPATGHGRQGLVELRAFEMPPHPRMVVAQMLLCRTLIAAFAAEPYQRPLIRWGQALHDRFLLPHAMWRDFEDVMAELARRDLPLPEAGYRPFLELRCPLVGTLLCGDVTLEVRTALEPWPVLGEELTATGTARYVDSSLERIEVRAHGLVPDRHAVLVNGHQVPLMPTERAGTFVAGIRFRAWAPPHSLQPHIGIHHPLRLDVVDTWARRSLGGCSYHVWHPEGRAFDAPPLTRFEAAARRAQRFTLDGPRPYPVVAAPATPNPAAPFTLDLRRLPIDRPMPAPATAEEEPAAEVESAETATAETAKIAGTVEEAAS